MSRIETALRNDVKALQLLHDELKLQAHLLKAEAKDRWAELETQLATLKAHLERAEVAADHAREEAEAAAGLLIESLQQGYTRIRNALSS